MPSIELPSFVHTPAQSQLEASQENQLRHDVEQLHHGAHIVSPRASGERTPLLLAGKHAVVADDDLDLAALNLRLNDEERAAIAADAITPSGDILRYEATQIVTLALPVVS
ncbi:hypothetical protein PINS_up006357 [Pythium insidiosum]|nr:hypothetical protein PINS_up006357 [Pythium insidiosum]